MTHEIKLSQTVHHRADGTWRTFQKDEWHRADDSCLKDALRVKKAKVVDERKGSAKAKTSRGKASKTKKK